MAQIHDVAGSGNFTQQFSRGCANLIGFASKKFGVEVALGGYVVIGGSKSRNIHSGIKAQYRGAGCDKISSVACQALGEEYYGRFRRQHGNYLTNPP